MVALFALHYPDEPHLEDVTVALRLPVAYGASVEEAHATVIQLYKSESCLYLTDLDGNEWWIWPETIRAFATLA